MFAFHKYPMNLDLHEMHLSNQGVFIQDDCIFTILDGFLNIKEGRDKASPSPPNGPYLSPGRG